MSSIHKQAFSRLGIEAAGRVVVSCREDVRCLEVLSLATTLSSILAWQELSLYRISRIVNYLHAVDAVDMPSVSCNLISTFRGGTCLSSPRSPPLPHFPPLTPLPSSTPSLPLLTLFSLGPDMVSSLLPSRLPNSLHTPQISSNPHFKPKLPPPFITFLHNIAASTPSSPSMPPHPPPTRYFLLPSTSSATCSSLPPTT
eukprot:768744-Hanusia_phi.AAC.6